MRHHRRGFSGRRHGGGRSRHVGGNRAPLYRSRGGMIMGVCQGIADHMDLRVFWVRMVALIGFLFTGFWPVGILYFIAGLILRPEPVVPLENEASREFYESYTDSRASALQRLKRKFDNIDRRIQRMEDTVTRREFEL